MRVAQLSTNDVVGGAAISAHRIHTGLCAAGVDSRMFVIKRSGPADDERVTEFRPFPFLPRKAQRLCDRVCRRLQNPVRCADDGSLFSMDWTCYRSLPLQGIPPAEVINLHWVAGLLDYGAMLPRLARAAPLVWTFHDMNAFTGGCHYSGNCERFTQSCGSCPKLLSDREHDRSRAVFERKRKALGQLSDTRLKIVTPSRWLATESSRSSLFCRFEHVLIPYGIDSTQFQPVDKQFARKELGLNADSQVVLFVADHIADQRKGLALLLETMEYVADLSRLRFVTMGQGDTSHMIGERYHHLGRIQDARRIGLIYSAADVFVIPSLQDNLPNTVLEAMACGTPVIGFDVGGIGEAVRAGETGLLAPLGDTAGLAHHLRFLLEDSETNRRMGIAARKRAVEEYTVELQAERYRALYTSLVENVRSAGDPPSRTMVSRP
jgi:glycosyltransferase involved in cell wall biosynthesis